MASVHEEIFLEEKEKSEGDLKTFLRLWVYIKKYKLLLFLTFLTLAIATIIELALPVFIRYGIDNVINVNYSFDMVPESRTQFVEQENGAYNLEKRDNNYYMVNNQTGERIQVSGEQYSQYFDTAIRKIQIFSLIFISVLVGQFLLNYGQVFFANVVGQKVIFHLRKDLFSHILKLKYTYFEKNPPGKVTTRVVNDTQNLSDFFSDVVTSFLKDIAIIIGVIILMMVLDFKLSLYTMSMFPVIVVSVVLFRHFDRKAYDKVRTRISALNSYLAENLAGSNVTRLFNQEERKKKEFDYMSTKVYRANLQQIYVFAIFRPLMSLLQYFTISILLWFGSLQLTDGQTTFGTIYAFTSYIDMFFRPLFDLAEKYDIMQNAFASAGKIFKIFDQEQEDFGRKKYDTIQEGKVEFQNVKFSYDGNTEVLKGVSFKINPNERIAIVGETGSGKTTIIKLISGLYKYQSGKILLDDKELYEYNLNELRKKIAVVPQDVFLFSGTILDNMRLFNQNIPDEEVKKVAKSVYAHEIISRLPQNYYTVITERGGTLSSGERQLVALTRAVLFNSKIIILDEATANVDVETEFLIQQALNKISERSTIISIAHRLSTVKSSNRIIVVHKGLVVEEGRHEELINNHGIYYDLYRLQFENS
ncbi:ABC transporter ATP-binding protein [Petrotoga sibirica DSM 13575]|uniref:ATP-binding cassette subfamily B protein/ATP-binding cassette subfamily C protein n=3 Tax=Petrotogaceae TaxID=1643949 RepID=A0A4R8EUL5_9BACT|nr:MULTISPECIES: ABC transporter ATP-binding protein [Petrotoga]POZ89466.1 ABC transporter ATP-binding protein [Petrotoga sibirica DSM 13575]POZ91908.1 ABC transporter ATP-binding protein [Petrotoga sp. SL27]TDX16274.1 ATP-binding cassette subfamily B protein/ATP-binding cassette subfamily C protein [Petrotoga sibirica]